MLNHGATLENHLPEILMFTNFSPSQGMGLFLDSGKDPDLSTLVKLGLLIQSVMNGFTVKGSLMELLYLGTTNTHTH